MRALQGIFVLAGLVAVAAPAQAGVQTFTSSAAFDAALTAPLTVENYSTGTAGQLIASGSSFDGLTYSFTAGPGGTLLGGIITNQFNSVSGLSLGGNQSSGQQFFFGGDSFTVTFAAPVNEIGIFFNVNLNSGNYSLTTSAGSVSTGSAADDTNTFVFDGLISDTPFTSATIISTNTALGSYNIPEIEFGTVPEPASLALFGMGLVGLAAIRRRRKQV